LLCEDGSEDSDAYYYAHELYMTDGVNDRAVHFGPWHRSRPYNEPLVGWVIKNADDEVIDAGMLSRPRRPRRGDSVIFPRGSIKSAMVGDVLGVTGVFMPSGFAVGVPPAVTLVSSGGGVMADFAYPEQQELPFWLPKRRWRELSQDDAADAAMSDTGYSMIRGWRQRLTAPDTGIKEVLRRGQQQLIAAGVL